MHRFNQVYNQSRLTPILQSCCQEFPGTKEKKKSKNKKEVAIGDCTKHAKAIMIIADFIPPES